MSNCCTTTKHSFTRHLPEFLNKEGAMVYVDLTSKTSLEVYSLSMVLKPIPRRPHTYLVEKLNYQDESNHFHGVWSLSHHPQHSHEEEERVHLVHDPDTGAYEIIPRDATMEEKYGDGDIPVTHAFSQIFL